MQSWGKKNNNKIISFATEEMLLRSAHRQEERILSKEWSIGLVQKKPAVKSVEGCGKGSSLG